MYDIGIFEIAVTAKYEDTEDTEDILKKVNWQTKFQFVKVTSIKRHRESFQHTLSISF